MKNKSNYKTPASTTLAKAITEIDKNDEGQGSPLNFTQATVISWKMISEYNHGSSKRSMISNILDNLPLLLVKPKNGHEKKGKFTQGQVERVNTALKILLKGYWWPWSDIRKILKNASKA